MTVRLTLAALIVAGAGLMAAPAHADFRYPWYPLVNDPRTGTLDNIPPCSAEEVQAKVVDAFNETETRFWGGHIEMTGVIGLTERGSLPRGDDKLARRWCQGTAVFRDGERRRIVLELLPNIETLGLRYALSYCIEGLDREWAYQPNCRVLAPKPF